jgi:hypothetical protein
MVPPGKTAFNGVNPRVTDTLDLPESRSDEAMENDAFIVRS